jgi:hypothetical protein
MNNLDIYCVTNKKVDFLEKTNLKLVGVGNEDFTKEYLRCDNEKNIYYKEKYYSELTFHYWYWKNILPIEKKEWIGFCQKRRFWIKPNENKNLISPQNLNEFLLTNIDEKFNSYESFICDPINISGAKKMKIIKRGWKNLIKDPSVIFDENKQSISLHFDMHHGYKNLDRAIELLDKKNKEDFLHYVKTKNYYNPHIMVIARPHILDKWFEELFTWLERCEEVFGFNKLKGYDTQRLYAYLAERYLSFWFKKHTKFKTNPWIFIDF